MIQAAIWIALGATLLGLLFASLRLALATLSKSRLADMATARGRAPTTARVNRILDDVSGYARAMALPQLICTLTVVMCIAWWLVQSGGAQPPGLVPALLAGLVAAVWLWLFIVLIPTSIAEHAGERMVYIFAGLVRTVYLIERPLGWIIRFLDEVVRRLAGAQKVSEQEELEAEILSVIDEGEREGTIDESEREMIEAVVEFRSTTVEQIMTPRTEVDALEATDELTTIIEFLKKVGHSRIPVFEQDLDHVLGILYAKDLLHWVTNGNKTFRLRDVLRPAIFVPEAKTVRELLTELIAQKVHIALVADEYGGTSGLVTIEDIVEEVFGEIQDEYEPADEAPPQIELVADERTAEADARAYIDDVNDALEPLGFEFPESDDYDTLGGFVITTLGRIPEPGESFLHGRATLTVLEATPTRVTKVRIAVGAREPESGAQAASNGNAAPAGEHAEQPASSRTDGK